jgi:subtilisin family serine protease
MKNRGGRRAEFSGRIEQLEDRRVMSADPAVDLLAGAGEPQASVATLAAADQSLDQHVLGQADFWIDPTDAAGLDDQSLNIIEEALSAAHTQTGWYNVESSYGFTGRGQTVAVIDSGIAYDHFALGGGLGANYRVVGGWDFTEENDGNPYDDGAAGGHGTHVSGIIGGSSSTSSGVAPGVDLVGLRVFNDAGQGFFSWVENALRWVHNNRNTFANPITTVNLSLGVSSWNAAAIPQWATLEDEFAELEADGIFIAVSAGNSFSSYNAAGLSYPAASSHVVPVMSTDAAGRLSGFSQRLDRAIAAPGQAIVSTVPDYKGNKNGRDDDFATMSGTSMAAPYVAGAAMLVRQAMEFAGMTNITQSTIYNEMMATADTIYDAVTKLSYKRLNLQAAIDGVMPADDFGSTVAAASDLGSLSGEQSVSGAIEKLNDADCFSFTASATGKATFDVTHSGEEFAGSWQVYDATGNQMVAAVAGKAAFDVQAGQSYTLRLTSTGGLGHYTFSASLKPDAALAYQNWGAVAFNQISDVAIAGEQWFRIQASQAGLLTVIGAINSAAGSLNLEIYDDSRQLLAAGAAVNGQARLDLSGSAGQEYFVRVTGAESHVDFTLVNLVQQAGSAVYVGGTSGDDVYSFTAGAVHQLVVNGVSYGFTANEVTTFSVDGGAGNDSIVINGSSGKDLITLRVGSAEVQGRNYEVSASRFEEATVNGGGGFDQASLYDSAGDDVFEAWPDHAQMTGEGYLSRVFDVHFIAGYASGGDDRSLQHDSALGDFFETWSDHAEMRGGGYLSQAWGFDTVTGYSSGGSDFAVMHDTSGDDEFRAWSDHAQLKTAEYAAYCYGFIGAGAIATTGNDKAILFDSAGDDYFEAHPDRAIMWGQNFVTLGVDFDQYWGVADRGDDRAALFDSSGNDEYQSWADRAQMIGPGYTLQASGFKRYAGVSTGGVDAAYLHDSAGDDLFEAWSDRASMSWTGYVSEARGFSAVYGDSTAGRDRAELYDSEGDDLYRAWSDRAQMKGAGYMNYAMGFADTVAQASQGEDRAILNDSAGDDHLLIRDWGVQLATSVSRQEVRGFDDITAVAKSGGNDTQEAEAVDYAFELIGDWK